MASWPPKKNAAFVFYVGLISQADTKLLQANPTLAAGDVKVATDDAAPGNLATLPVVDADFTDRVKVSMSAGEMNGDRITVIFSDAAGAEWTDLLIDIPTSVRQIDDLSYPTVSGRSTDVLATGEIPIDFDTSIGTLAAAQIEASALDGKGDWNIGKTGYTAGPTAASFTTAAWAAGAIDAAALAADAIQKIADGILPKKNTALSDIPFLMVLSSDGVTPATGLTVTATRSIDGGTTFSATTGTVTEATNGYYHFDASAADMNGALVTFKFSAATANDTGVSIRTGG